MWKERKMNTKCACGARGDAKLKVKRGAMRASFG